MLRFLWTCETTTMGTQDLSVGDTTAAASGGVSLGTGAGIYGTNGIVAAAVGADARYQFDATTGIVDPNLGALAFAFRWSGALPVVDDTGIWVYRDAASDDAIRIVQLSNGDLRLQIEAGGVSQNLDLTGAGIVADTVYHALARWDQATSRRWLGLYNASRVLIASVESRASFTACAASDSTTGLRFGVINNITITLHMDNILIADDYDEPLENNLNCVDRDDYLAEISFDVATEHVRTGTTSPQTFSHAAASSGVAAVVIKITHGVSTTDHVSAVSYGGVACTEQQRNTDGAGELGATEIWTLLASIPQGTQTVSYTPGATTDDIHCVVETYICDRAVEVVDKDGVSGGDPANPSVTLSNPNGQWALATATLYGGGAAPSSFTPDAWHRTVHDHDLGAFYSESFRMVSPSRAASIPSGGTSVADDVALASILLAPTLQIRPLLGRLTLASLVAAVAQDVSVAAAAGSLVLAAQTADVALDTTIDVQVDLGTLVLAPQAATVALEAAIAAAVGSLTLAPQASTVALEAAIAAAAGALTLAAQAAIVVQDQDVPVDLGALTLSPLTAAVDLVLDVPVQLGTLAFTAQASAVTLEAAIAAGAGALTLASLQATVLLDSDLAAQVATLVLAAGQADVQVGIIVSGVTAALSLSPQAAEVLLDIALAAQAGSLSLQAQAAIVTLEVGIAAGVAALALSADPALVELATAIDVAIGSLTLEALEALVEGGPAVVIELPDDQVLVLSDRAPFVTVASVRGSPQLSVVPSVGVGRISPLPGAARIRPI